MITRFIQRCFADPAPWQAYVNALAALPENF